MQHARFLLSLQLSLHFQLRGDGFLLLPQPNLQGLLFLSRTTVCLIIGLLHRREQGNHSGNGGHSSAGAGEGNEGQGKPLGRCTPTTHLNLHVCAGGISGSATVDFLLYLRHTANLCLYIENMPRAHQIPCSGRRGVNPSGCHTWILSARRWISSLRCCSFRSMIRRDSAMSAWSAANAASRSCCFRCKEKHGQKENIMVTNPTRTTALARRKKLERVRLLRLGVRVCLWECRVLLGCVHGIHTRSRSTLSRLDSSAIWR